MATLRWFHSLYLLVFLFWFFCLPHATASVERQFWTMNWVKDPLKNRMTLETTKGRMLARQAVRACGGCYAYNPSDEELRDAVNGGPYKRYSQRCGSESTARKVVFLEAMEDEI